MVLQNKRIKNIQLNHFGCHSRHAWLSFFCSSDVFRSLVIQHTCGAHGPTFIVSLLELSASVLNPDFHCIKEQHGDSSEFLLLSNNIMTDCSCLDEACLSESTFASVILTLFNEEWSLQYDPHMKWMKGPDLWPRPHAVATLESYGGEMNCPDTHTHTPSVFSQVARWTPEIHKLSRKSLFSPFDAPLRFFLFPACVSQSLMMSPVSALYLSICVLTLSLSLSVEFAARV